MINRSVLTKLKIRAANKSCLGCADCKGSCWAAFELATTPAAILKSKEK